MLALVEELLVTVHEAWDEAMLVSSIRRNVLLVGDLDRVHLLCNFLHSLLLQLLGDHLLVELSQLRL